MGGGLQFHDCSSKARRSAQHLLNRTWPGAPFTNQVSYNLWRLRTVVASAIAKMDVLSLALLAD